MLGGPVCCFGPAVAHRARPGCCCSDAFALHKVLRDDSLRAAYDRDLKQAELRQPETFQDELEVAELEDELIDGQAGTVLRASGVIPGHEDEPWIDTSNFQCVRACLLPQGNECWHMHADAATCTS